jgi:outer membrane murein-binding lipoprotein Lpp
MKNKRVVVSLLLVCFVTLALSAGCIPAKATTTQTPVVNTPLQLLTSRVDSLETQVQSVKKAVQDIADTTGDDQSAAIEEIQTQVTDLQTQIDELIAKIDKLSDSANGGTTGTGEETKWSIDVDLTSANIPDTIAYDIYSEDGTIKEDGIYEITLEIENSGNSTVNLNSLDMDIEVTLDPKINTLINQKTTYLDSDRRPYLDWEPDFTIRSGLCTRITFIAEECDFGSYDSLGAGKILSLKLMLELHYT